MPPLRDDELGEDHHHERPRLSRCTGGPPPASGRSDRGTAPRRCRAGTASRPRPTPPASACGFGVEVEVDRPRLRGLERLRVVGGPDFVASFTAETNASATVRAGIRGRASTRTGCPSCTSTGTSVTTMLGSRSSPALSRTSCVRPRRYRSSEPLTISGMTTFTKSSGARSILRDVAFGARRAGCPVPQRRAARAEGPARERAPPILQLERNRRRPSHGWTTRSSVGRIERIDAERLGGRGVEIADTSTMWLTPIAPARTVPRRSCRITSP